MLDMVTTCHFVKQIIISAMKHNQQDNVEIVSPHHQTTDF